MCDTGWEKPIDPDGPPPFSLSSWIDLAPFERILGMEIVRAEGGVAVLKMPFVVKLAQGKGLLHGGAITALADTAGAMAMKSLLAENTHFATVELSTSFLAPVRRGTVTARAVAEADPERERTYRVRASVSDDEGKEVAEFRSLFRVASRKG